MQMYKLIPNYGIIYRKSSEISNFVIWVICLKIAGQIEELKQLKQNKGYE